MDGRQFLTVARFAAQESDEEWQRTAGGRAYYAMFLEARAALVRWGFANIPSYQAHAYVRSRFANALPPDLKRIGNALEYLYNVRARADYEIAQTFFTAYVVERAIDDAADMIDLLDAIDADPVRRAT